MRENGLQLDQPPAVGNISSIRIVIEKSDNAEGVIEFDPQYLTLHGKLSACFEVQLEPHNDLMDIGLQQHLCVTCPNTPFYQLVYVQNVHIE